MTLSADRFFGPAQEWLPEELLGRLIQYQGEEKANEWLGRLPDLLREWSERWQLSFDPKPPFLTYNIVLFADSAIHGPVVLKTHPPSAEFLSELHAIRQSQGEGIVKLHDADPDAAMMLLGRVLPGDVMMDANLPDEEATTHGARAMRHFSKPVQDGTRLFELRPWLRELLDYPVSPTYAPVLQHLLEAALDTAEQLFATSPEPCLLHGDLHHGNLLRNETGGWTIIDPKGLIGDPAYDVATWMLNPWGMGEHPDLAAIARRRLEIFEQELGIPRVRLAEWSFCHAVLVLCWAAKTDSEEQVLAYSNPATVFLDIVREYRNL